MNPRRGAGSRKTPRPEHSPYRVYIEGRCLDRLQREQHFLPYPHPTQHVEVRVAERGKPCSLCEDPIPTNPEIDPKPQEYVFQSGIVMRLHGLRYTGAPDGSTSCLSVWQHMTARRSRGD